MKSPPFLECQKYLKINILCFSNNTTLSQTLVLLTLVNVTVRLI